MKTGNILTGRRSVFLGAITSDLLTEAVESQWFDNEEDNRLLGFGKGITGTVESRRRFQNFIEGSDTFIPQGIYLHGKPVGICGVNVDSNKHKTGTITIYVPPKNRHYKVSTTSILALCDTFFNSGGYRLEVQVLRINKLAIDFFRKYGFTQESIKKSSHWMDNNVYDEVILRMLRKDWI